jgi:hypothetical protein
LTSIRGATLGVTLADRPFGKIKVDFAEDVLFTPEVAKTLLLKSLARRGAMINEIEEGGCRHAQEDDAEVQDGVLDRSRSAKLRKRSACSKRVAHARRLWPCAMEGEGCEAAVPWPNCCPNIAALQSGRAAQAHDCRDPPLG